ncbi:MAG TPA: metal ABC transporter ATP-binding protein [Acidimicrobiales bacterium]|nr:metal ABC transporter ATP-binding protein [Acidimicrobiales bacterium]
MSVPAAIDLAETAAPKTPSEAGPALCVDGLTVWLQGREVLHDVSFSLAAGEVTGLIGMNGAGKTTLLRAILGLQPVTSGQVRLAGGRLGRRSVGYVPQKVVLDPDLPVRARDLVELGLDGRRLGLPLRSRSKRTVVDGLLSAVDALHLADARVGALSGGEQQRVLIAHALARHPQLLLLDEPLANLDLPSTQETVRLLGRIAREQKVAILLSTHDVNPLLPVMDRVIYLAAGRAASGKTDEVVRSDVLSELYGRHVDVFRAHGRLLVSVGEEHGEDGCDATEVPTSEATGADATGSNATGSDCDEGTAPAERDIGTGPHPAVVLMAGEGQ